MTISRIAVLGTGANGAAVGAALTAAGHHVVLIDQWVQNVEAMRADGVTVHAGGRTTVTPVRAHHLSDVASMREPFDLVIVGLKAYDTDWGTRLIAPLLAPDGVVVGMQNGMTVDVMADAAGRERTLGCVIEVAANMFVPGVVQQQAPLWFALGAPDGGPQSRAAEVAEVFAAAGTATVTDDILSSKWMKLIANSCELVTSAILDLPLADAIAVPGMFEVMLATGEETARIAVAEGHRIVSVFGMQGVDGLSPEAYARRLLDAVLGSYTLPDTLTTVLQDWRKGRRAEIEEINGEVVRAGARQGMPTPANTLVRDLARRVERGELTAAPSLAPLMTGAGLSSTVQ